MSDGPPPLPSDLPADLRAFVDCHTDRVELRGGKAAWIPVPPVLKKTIGLFLRRPSAKITPLAEAGTALVGVKWALVGLDLRATVVEGRLVLTADGRRSGMLAEVYAEVDSWVGNLNDWLAKNGHRLAPLDVAPDRIALRKEPLH